MVHHIDFRKVDQFKLSLYKMKHFMLDSQIILFLIFFPNDRFI